MPYRSADSLLNRTGWLLAIGEWLRDEYDPVAEPLPERLTALIAQLGTPAGTPAEAKQATRVNGSKPEG
ncbi:MAG TPA: hypothetical protein VKB89_11285 [Xanthobacteraceae bacterium]|nr:hypothetical protein [Xanthobacteraceae bacterium]